jgi:Holliday junction resolvase RusA-like endonuclease
MTITVIGMPAPQGSKRHIGKGVMIESSKKVKPWREAVKWAAVEVMSRPDHMPDRPTIRGPVDIAMTFTVPKPKSAPKSRQTWPDRKPDVDKLCRSTLDALVEAGAIEDDARVVRLSAAKVFPGEGQDALRVPGAVIRIEAVDAVIAAAGER